MGSSHSSNSSRNTSSTVDVALLSEAHGLVTDMLADPSLPPHVLSGLRALATLLSPPNHAAAHGHPRPRPGGAAVAVALVDFNSGSDTEEIPYTGERPSALPKRLRRNLPPSLLRRMSTSTWTTTTSATGMPTLEAEPIRKRSTSFRHTTEGGHDGKGLSASAQVTNGDVSKTTSNHQRNSSPSRMSSAISAPEMMVATTGGACKGRSYSTTSIPVVGQHRKAIRERKTVCSLHPLTSSDLEALHAMADTACDSTSQTQQASAEDGDAETTEDESREGDHLHPLPPLPSIRRLNITSDYESSNDSPSGSDNNDATVTDEACLRRVAGQPKSLGVQTTEGGARCSLCGARTRLSSTGGSTSAQPGSVKESGRLSASSDPDDRTPTPAPVEDVQPCSENGALEGTRHIVDGVLLHLESLANCALLNAINEWDYPIFELSSQSGDFILSQMCYKVFLEVGLFESFKIPMQEFLNYFHALENGYREKPYHNRMHAADVLHGVYYLTSQPIPGFAQMPTDSTDSPLHRTLTDDCYVQPVHRKSFVAEDSYGIMGANFPALELMALYTAAAMHDFDHPGRTNAFLVSTYAPQAVLYNDRSVLENHHAAAAWSLFLSRPQYNWLYHLDKAEFKRFRFLVIECILATDLKRHFEILAEFNAKANDDDAPGVDWLCEADRMLLMQMCIKLADINGPCKRHDIHVQWTYRIAEEFYEQGDEEANLGLTISPYMDRRNPQLAKLQESFINHLVAPLCNAYGESGLLPGHWADTLDSEDDVPGDGDKGRDTEDELIDSDASSHVAPEVTKVRRASRQLKPRRVLCLQTKHLQENYEHWIGILKEERGETTPAPVPAAQGEPSSSGTSSGAVAAAAVCAAAVATVVTAEDGGESLVLDGEDLDDDDDDDDDESQGEMETIHEEDSSSPKSTPPRDNC